VGGVKVRIFDADWMRFPADPEGRASGPVKAYKLSPEELAEFNNLRKPAGKAPINLPPGGGKKRKEAEEMFIGENGTENMPKNMPTEPGNIGQEAQDSTGQEDKSKTRMEILRLKLTEEQYLAMKEEGFSDAAILKRLDLKYWIDVLTQLKKEWGLGGLGLRKAPIPNAEPLECLNVDPPPTRTVDDAAQILARVDNIRKNLGEEPKEEPKTQTPAPGFTIAQAMDLRDELIEDVDDLNHVLRKCEEWVSGRILMALRLQLDIHQQALDRINEVFERTVVEL